MTDAAVVRRVLEGDVDAFAILVDRYSDRYARFAVHMVGNREDAEEALQDAFVRAYRSLAQYREQERFSAWLYQILVNQCRTAIAKRRRLDATYVDVDPAELTVSDVCTPHAADALPLRDRLDRALAQLPPDQREAVVLKYTEDLSYEDMAAITGAGVSALKMRVKRAFVRLRELLEEAYSV